MTPPNLRAIVSAAIAAETRTSVPADMIVAQCALETGWLRSMQGNNAFGVKWTGSGPRQLLTTREWFTPQELSRWLAQPKFAERVVINATGRTNKARAEYAVKDWFAAYDSLADSFAAHARLISEGRPYRTAWRAYLDHRSVERLVADIAPVYATSPAYAPELMRIINMTSVRAELATQRRGIPQADQPHPDGRTEPPSAV